MKRIKILRTETGLETIMSVKYRLLKRKAMNRHHSATVSNVKSPGCTSILKPFYSLGGKAFPDTTPDEAVTRAKSFG